MKVKGWKWAGGGAGGERSRGRGEGVMDVDFESQMLVNLLITNSFALRTH